MTAPTQQTLALADAVLRDFYAPAIATQLNGDLPLFKALSRRTAGWFGRRYVIPLHIERSQAVKAAPEGGALPAAQAQGYTEASVRRKTLLARGRLTGEAIEQARTSRGAFRDLIDEEVSRLRQDIIADAGRQIWGRGDGVLAQLNGAVAAGATTVVVDNPGTRFLARNMLLDVWSSRGSGATLQKTGAEIASVDSATQFTLSAAPGGSGLTDDYFITRQNVRAASEFYELDGLEAMVDDGGYVTTYQGVSRTTYPAWKSTVLGNAGTPRDLSLQLLQQAYNTIENRSGLEPNLIVAHSSVWEEYAALLFEDRRFTSTSFDGGARTLTFTNGGRDIEFKKDRFAPYGKVFLLNTDHIHVYQVADFGFMERDGSILSRVADTFAYEFTVFFMGNLGTTRCNAHGRIDDITATVV